MWKYFVLGVLVGWLVEWIIDWWFWRRPADSGPPAAPAGTRPLAQAVAPAASQPSPQASPQTPAAASGGDRFGGAEADAGMSGMSAAGRTGGTTGTTGTTASAGTTAGTIAGDVALGAPGAVSTSSATLTTRAPVYRQEDLEAIAGIGPKIGAMLRNNGITTFAELAATPVAELARIVESTGEQPTQVGLQSWGEQARLAAAQDWAGLAALQHGQPAEFTSGEA